MNLSISPIKYSNCPNFGMAKFTKRGVELAKTQEDTFTPFKEPTIFQSPEFFKKTKPLQKAPLAKFISGEKKPENIYNTIKECGNTGNAELNARFVKQLLESKKTISKTSAEVQNAVKDAASDVFGNNWDNPLLSKKETLELLNMTNLPDKVIVAATGVIEKSDSK